MNTNDAEIDDWHVSWFEQGVFNNFIVFYFWPTLIFFMGKVRSTYASIWPQQLDGRQAHTNGEQMANGRPSEGVLTS